MSEQTTDRHLVVCLKCGKLVDERGCVPSVDYKESICPDCQQAKHAPSPWGIGLETDNESIQIISSDGQDLATVRQYPLKANATLIASAPELLAAAFLLIDDTSIDEPLECASFDALRSAILKATGGTE